MDMGMTNMVSTSHELVPHLVCWNRTMPLIWLHVISDFIIAFSYFSIPAALLMIIIRKPNIQFKLLFFLFASFIIACGSTHIMGMVTIWKPWFWAEGYVKLWCAIVSIFTAIYLYPLLPSILSVKDKSVYEQENKDLELELKKKGNIIDKIIKID